MKRAIRAIVAALAVIAPSGLAFAQSNRTFVSGTGTDSGPCSISAPCRSFAYAVTQTAANGELVVKDGAGYGPVTITQSITIANDGVGTAAISVPSNGTGIEIKAGTNDTVHIRGIEIDGNGVGRYGINIDSAGRVEIINAIIRHLTGIGVEIRATNTNISIAGSLIADNGSSGAGINLEYTASATMTIDNTKVEGHENGIGLCGSGVTTITRSSASSNYVGIVSGSQCKGTTVVRDSVITGNQIGVETVAGNILVSHSVVAGNQIYGLWQTGGQLVTYGDNNINFNGQDVNGTITKYSPE